MLIGLLPAIILAVMDFVKARDAMQSAIEHDLVAQADTLAVDINKILFERLQNAATWSSLEVMQDLQVQDVDRRLSLFLTKLKSGYGGVYLEIYAVNRQRQVVSSSNPGDLGKSLPSPKAWQDIHLAGANLSIARPEVRPGAASLMISAPIISQFDSAVLGQLQLAFDWTQIETLLDSTALHQHMVMLVDREGRVLAVSRNLRGIPSASWRDLAAWQLARRPTGAFEHLGGPIATAPLLVGLGRASDFAGFAGPGLTVLVIQKQSDALAPIHHMALMSLGLLALLVLLILLMAGWISGLIASPIVALTHFTRSYKHGQASTMPESLANGGEVGELSVAFLLMMQEIELSQRKLVQASKLAAVGEMSSVIAHEVRTPLGILRSSAQMLQREAGLSAEGRELMGFIVSETERLNRLVSSMLDSARPRALLRTPVDLHDLVLHSSSLLAAQMEKHHIVVSHVFEAINPVLECDAEQITQVLLNLILNGIQILAHGGQLRLAVRDIPEQVLIEIEDNGPGIPPEERSRIFEAFFFRREGGVGLGLAIVQQIIIAHGGEIEASESDLGGARFLIRLPRTQRLAESEQ